MKTSQLKSILNYILPCTNVKVYDVSAYDQLNVSNINKFPAAFILNTAKHTHPGIHWICLYFKSAKDIFFFCSYGHSAEFYNFTNIRPTTWNTTRFQSINSNKCGHFSLVVLHQLALNNSFERALSLFSKNNTNRNDAIVQKYLNKIYRLRQQTLKHSGQQCVTLRAFKNEYKRTRKYL